MQKDISPGQLRYIYREIMVYPTLNLKVGNADYVAKNNILLLYVDSACSIVVDEHGSIVCINNYFMTRNTRLLCC